MRLHLFTQSARFLAEKYQQIEDYFTKGSFVIKFYPFLMHPCVRRTQRLTMKLAGILALFLGIDFLFVELLAALFSDASLAAYLKHTAFELSLPPATLIEGNATLPSPLSFSMRSAFLLQAYLFFGVFLFGAVRLSPRFRLASGLFSLFFCSGMFILYHTQSGKFVADTLQNLGASLTFLCGNLAMLLIGLGVKSPTLRRFKRQSIAFGLIGVAAIASTLFYPSPYLALVERLGVSCIMLAEIALGFAILTHARRPANALHNHQPSH